MTPFEKAKIIYKEIALAITSWNAKHDMQCGLPNYIELDGIIYQAYQCLDREWTDHTLLASEQMNRVLKGKTTFYNPEYNDPTLKSQSHQNIYRD